MTPPSSTKRPRYQKVRALSQHPQNRRQTYLGRDNKTGQTVVIKQFHFAPGGNDWAGVDAYRPRVEQLLRFGHPRIPRYLSLLPQKTGFCLVREAPQQVRPLEKLPPLEPAQSQQVAIAVLDVLTYLHGLDPPLLHTNLSPSNILVDAKLNVYLTDFGFPYHSPRGKAKQDWAGSEGLMPKEQLRNQDLTAASDLYSLGISLLSQLAQCPPPKLQTQTDTNGRLDVLGLVPQTMSLDFIDWLERMTETFAGRRFSTATEALETLQDLEAVRYPQAILNCERLDLVADAYGESLQAQIALKNPVPETTLTGTWTLADHPGDRKSRSDNWVTIAAQSPQETEQNTEQNTEQTFTVTIDSRKLLAETTYERELVFTANTAAQTHRLPLRVVTAALIPEPVAIAPLGIVGGAGLLAGLIFGLLGRGTEGAAVAQRTALICGMIFGGGSGLGAIFGLWQLAGGLLSPLALLRSRALRRSLRRGGVMLLLLVGWVLGLGVFGLAGYLARKQMGIEESWGVQGLMAMQTWRFVVLGAFGVFLGSLLTLGFDPLGMLATVGTGAAVGWLVGGQWFRQQQALKRYQKARSRLVKP
ncbi:MAG: protein kinase [Cyanobacteria bacterium P01_G01_bin.54]